jgi:hypothetical protein
MELRERWLTRVEIYRIVAVVAYGGRCEACGSADDLDFVLSRDSLLVCREDDDMDRINARDRLVARIGRTGVLPDRELVLLCAGCRRAAEWVPPETWRCSSCKVVKPVAEFWADHRRPSGIQSACKVCQGRRQKERKHALRAERQAAGRS